MKGVKKKRKKINHKLATNIVRSPNRAANFSNHIKSRKGVCKAYVDTIDTFK